MIGTNTITFNMEQAKDILEKHIKDEILRDGDFSVTKVDYDYTKSAFTITMEPKG